MLTFLLAILFVTGYRVSAQPPIGDSSKGVEFVEGEILVKFKPGLGIQDTRQRLAGVSGLAVQTIAAIDVIQVRVPQGQEQAAIAQLRTRADIEFAEPNYIFWALETPNDPGFGNQWGLSTIGLPAAWSITQGSSDLIVAVVDTGIDLDHPDFSCLVAGGASKLTTGYNYFTPDNSNPNDDNLHGSHVAGIIGACTNNATGVAGVAPNARLMPVKVLNSGGSGTSASVASGITYAVNNGAKIINLSLGGPGVGSVLEDAINYAHSQGVLVIAASGNAGSSPIFYPAAFNNAMAVGSTTYNDTRSYFSNYGPGLDVVAPGGSNGSGLNGIYSTVINSYNYLSGTSMSTPHVAGLAALIWAVDSSLTHDQVRQVIRDTAIDLGAIGWDQFYGYGRIDAWKALEKYSINLQTVLGLEISQPILFLVDDSAGPTPAANTVKVTTANPNIIDWTATISPPVTWLTISPPDSGTISAQTSNNLTLTAARPASYGTYGTTLVVTGTTSSGSVVGPTTASVQINYVPQLYRYSFPLILKK